MTITELNAPFKRKRIITYGADHNTAICKNVDLQHIIGTIYKGKDKKDQCGQSMCRFYCFFEEFEIGIDLGAKLYPELIKVEEIESFMKEQKMETPEKYFALLDNYVLNGSYITNANIKLAEHIAPERVPQYVNARQEYLLKEKKKQEKHAAEVKAEEEAFCTRKNAEIVSLVKKAVSIMLNSGEVDNKKIRIYSSFCDYKETCLINYLAQKYNVKIPIKVKGWISKSLVSVKIEDKVPVGYSYIGNKSNTFDKYFAILLNMIEKVSEN